VLFRSGTACTPCVAPIGGTSVCTAAGACEFVCEPGSVRVGSSCAPTCGNRAVDTGEECDDGNVVGGDGCDPRCVLEPASTAGGCSATNIVLRPGTQQYLGTTIGGSATRRSLDCGGSGPERFYQVRAEGGASVMVELYPASGGSSYEPVLYVAAGATCATPDPISAPCDRAFVPGMPVTVRAGVRTSTSFLVVADSGSTTRGGPYRLVLTLN
jgi:cysteine-rich repeat protein